MEKIKVYRLTDGSSSLIVTSIDELVPELENLEVDDSFEIICEMMDKEKFEALNEFDGF